MTHPNTIYVLGAGAIGLALATFLTAKGRQVIVVRTSTSDVPAGEITVTVSQDVEAPLKASVKTVSLSKLAVLDGIVVVTAKSYANPDIASALTAKNITGPLVIMQNGIGVEKPFLESLPTRIYRCVLYATSQRNIDHNIVFRPITSSPVGIVRGTELELNHCVTNLITPGFQFHSELNLPKEIWKKTIINSVFNSICPLLEVDNGVFVRHHAVAALAAELIRECIILAERNGIVLTEAGLMEQIMKISRGSTGVLISTLQDMKSGRPTEIANLNLELARMAASLEPAVNLGKTEFLGKMILAKSAMP